MRGKATFLSLDDVAVGGLQEATIPTDDFMFGVAGECYEARGSVNNGGIELADVDNEE